MDASGPFDRVLAAARAGEGWALADLFRDLHPRVRRYLVGLAPNHADDLASDTWLDVVRALDRFRGTDADLRALAFSMARTRLTEVHDDRPVDAVATVRDLDPALERLDTEIAVDRVLALPLEQAEVILLRALGGLSVAEVARTLEQPPRTIRRLQREGLLALAEETSDERRAT